MKPTTQRIYETRCLHEILTTVEVHIKNTKSSIIVHEDDYCIDIVIDESKLLQIRLHNFDEEEAKLEAVATIINSGVTTYYTHMENIDTFRIHTKTKEALQKVGLL